MNNLDERGVRVLIDDFGTIGCQIFYLEVELLDHLVLYGLQGTHSSLLPEWNLARIVTEV